jgi:hypothetical protein
MTFNRPEDGQSGVISLTYREHENGDSIINIMLKSEDIDEIQHEPI